MKRVTSSDKSHVLDLLTRAFDDNKSVNYVVKQDEKWVERIRVLMNYAFNVCEAFGEVWLSDNQQACALILFPERKSFFFRTAVWDSRLALSVIGLGRVSAVLKKEERIKANYPHEPFTYL